MRKIAANYILMPGYPLVKNGYMEWEKGREVRVVDVGPVFKEWAGWEFYGGLLVDSRVQMLVETWTTGSEIVPDIERLYVSTGRNVQGIALIQGIDYRTFSWSARAFIELLV